MSKGRDLQEMFDVLIWNQFEMTVVYCEAEKNCMGGQLWFLPQPFLFSI